MTQQTIQYTFEFTPVKETDLPLLYSWFKRPHIAQWWPVPEEKEDFFNKFLTRIRPESTTKPFIVLCNNIPIGYLQSYSVDTAGYHAWLPKISGNIIGIDQFIGEPDYLNRGFGTLFIKEFINNLAARNKNFTVVVDPAPKNTIAIRCYEKVGFTKLGEYQAPWGPALVMTLGASSKIGPQKEKSLNLSAHIY